MKRLLLKFLPILLLAFFVTACEDSGTDPDPDPVGKGSVNLSSTPSGAAILINNQPSGRNTPSVISDLDPGSINVTLRLDGYRDTTFSMTVTANFETPRHVELTQNPPSLQNYSGLRIYERESNNLSGVNLSSGTVVGSGAANTDFFYVGLVGNARVIRSQHLRTPVPTTQRMTRFNNTTNTNLNDGVDSPVYQNTTAQWAFEKFDDGNYTFIYDQDNHYSKLKITGSGQDGPFDRWITVDIIYNNTVNDVRF
jgi:hypothetical protein